jgi:hypothetical protein
MNLQANGLTIFIYNMKIEEKQKKNSWIHEKDSGDELVHFHI